MAQFQVGGHGGQYQLVNKGEFIYKPVVRKEVSFYESTLNTELKPFLPKYYGVTEDDFGQGTMNYFKMENLIHGMVHPCVLDIKMGSRTWCEDYSSDKIAYKQSIDESTSSVQYAFRFCGMKVYDKKDDITVQFDKKEAVKMKDEKDLKQMFKCFFASLGSLVEEQNPKFSSSISQIQIGDFLNSKEILNLSVYKNILTKVINKLTHFIQIFEKEDYQIISSSLFFYYDLEDPINTIDFKMIDFAEWRDKSNHYETSEQYSHGIKNIITILQSLRQEI